MRGAPDIRLIWRDVLRTVQFLIFLKRCLKRILSCILKRKMIE
jgi:hypothetical protein